MAYKVLNILGDLPKTNCRECGKSGCFAFATSVYLEGQDPSGCPHLSEADCSRMRALVAEDRKQGGGKKDPLHEQAIVNLRKKVAGEDLCALAARAGGRCENGEAVVRFLDTEYSIGKTEVRALSGPAPSVWVKIFLYIYLTRAAETRPSGEWVAFRELPNTTSKAKSFEACADKIADHFSMRAQKLDEAAKNLGAQATAFGSADFAWRIDALPKVALILLYWEGTEEFGARAAMLVDKKILDYLDQEASVFLAEALSNRLCGEGINEVIP